MFLKKIANLKKGETRAYLLLLVLLPIIIYFYFLRWKTHSIHDDDLFIFKAYSDSKSFFEKINLSTTFGQFRPVRDMFLHLSFQLFHKNPHAYYYLNVLVQSLNTIVFASLLNLLLHSRYLSFCFSLILALSRFSYYNTTQLFEGALLEGVAMTFFLLFLYCLVKISAKNTTTEAQQQKGLLWSIFFANLCMYTHERYIVLFPFILLMIVFFPNFKKISRRQKLSLAFITITSPVINIVIKKFVYSLSFLTGTGGTNIQFSFSSAFLSLTKAVLTIFQINTGPEYLVGFQFIALPLFFKVLAIFGIGVILLTFFLFLAKRVSQSAYKQNLDLSSLYLFLFLPFLFFLFLVPVIFQIRMELRWFQASLCVLILMFVIALMRQPYQSNSIKYLLSSVMIISFLGTDYYYLNKGAKNLYYSTSARIGDAFDKAIKDSIIHLEKAKLYIWEKHRNPDRENEINWALVGGYFFQPYQSNIKSLVFVDSSYQKRDTSFEFSFRDFNTNTDQIIFLGIQNDEDQAFKYSVMDITSRLVSDSFKKFDVENTDKAAFHSQVQYNQKQLLITNNDFDKFSTTGFYDNENGIRWTSGNASIAFMGDYTANDSLNIELNTYMPPVCKNINPAISLVDINSKSYQPAFSKRKGDKFTFTFYFKQQTVLQKIIFLSPTINSAPDVRTLSFPFVSLELKQ